MEGAASGQIGKLKKPPTPRLFLEEPRIVARTLQLENGSSCLNLHEAAYPRETRRDMYARCKRNLRNRKAALRAAAIDDRRGTVHRLLCHGGQQNLHFSLFSNASPLSVSI